MRARNIKPGFFTNETLGTQEPIICLLFAGLWCLADRRGRLEDRPLRIKAELFPYRDSLEIHRYLTVLSRLNFIHRYRERDDFCLGREPKAFIQVVNFDKHQSPHHTEKDSVIPAFSETCHITVNSPLEHGGNPPDSLIHRFTDSLIQNTPLTPLKGDAPRKKKRVSTVLESTGPERDAFEAFRALYSQSGGWIGTALAEEAWQSAILGLGKHHKAHGPTQAQTIMDGIQDWLTSEQWARHDSRICAPAVWLNQRRWADHPKQKEKSAYGSGGEFELSF